MDDIVVRQADKGGSITVLDKELYFQEYKKNVVGWHYIQKTSVWSHSYSLAK